MSEAEGQKKVSELLDDGLIGLVSAAKDASVVLDVIAEKTGRSGGVVSSSDCCLIISAALDRSNADLAISVFDAMRSTFDNGTFPFFSLSALVVISPNVEGIKPISFEIAHSPQVWKL